MSSAVKFKACALFLAIIALAELPRLIISPSRGPLPPVGQKILAGPSVLAEPLAKERSAENARQECKETAIEDGSLRKRRSQTETTFPRPQDQKAPLRRNRANQGEQGVSRPADSLGLSVNLEIESTVTASSLDQFLRQTRSELAALTLGGNLEDGLQVSAVKILRAFGPKQHLEGLVAIQRFLDERRNRLFVRITEAGLAMRTLARRMNWSPESQEVLFLILGRNAVNQDLLKLSRRSRDGQVHLILGHDGHQLSIQPVPTTPKVKGNQS